MEVVYLQKSCGISLMSSRQHHLTSPYIRYLTAQNKCRADGSVIVRKYALGKSDSNTFNNFDCPTRYSFGWRNILAPVLKKTHQSHFFNTTHSDSSDISELQIQYCFAVCYVWLCTSSWSLDNAVRIDAAIPIVRNL